MQHALLGCEQNAPPHCFAASLHGCRVSAGAAVALACMRLPAREVVGVCHGVCIRLSSRSSRHSTYKDLRRACRSAGTLLQQADKLRRTAGESGEHRT